MANKAVAKRETLAEKYAEHCVIILEAFSGADDFRASAPALLREIALATGCEAAVLLVRDGRDEYPCFCREGLDDRSCEPEDRLFRRDGVGRPAVEGLFATSGPADGGSLWTNSASSPTTGALRELAAARGWESAALLPLRCARELVGFLLIGSRQAGRFDREALRFLEQVARLAARSAQAMRCLEELAWLRRELEEQARGREQLLVMGEMASSLAHEIKNPLAGMTLSAGRLLKALQDDPKLKLIAGSLTAGINSLCEIVDRITGKVAQPELGLEPVDVNRVLEEAVRSVGRRAEAQGIRIVYGLAPGLPAVSGDERLLRRAFRNVLANAVEAMPSGGVLRLESRGVSGGRIEAIVADSGPGVPPELAANPFKPFRSTKPGRAGLGLSVARRILELHGGEAGLRPGAGGGTEVVLGLPVARKGGRQP